MKDLERALSDITAIRSQLARGTEFRGYGPVTVATTGLMALLAAVMQALLLPAPAAAPSPIWCCGSAWRRSPYCSPAPR